MLNHLSQWRGFATPKEAVLKGIRYCVPIPMFLCAAFTACPAKAQVPPDDPVRQEPGGRQAGGDSGSTVVYDADFFQRFDVITVVDMLERIPGVPTILNAVDEGESADVRGFGSSGDQILIDGRRIAGKANDLMSTLERIQAPLVEHIELIRGTSPDINVRSEGTIVNIVLHEDANIGSLLTWEVGGAHLLERTTEPVGSLSYSGGAGSLTYQVGVDHSQTTLSRQLRDHWLFTPEGLRFEEYEEIRDEDATETSATTNLKYDLGDGREVKLNGLLTHENDVTIEPRDRFAVDGTGSRTFTSTLVRHELEDEREWEIGGDYTHPVAATGRLNLLFVRNVSNENVEQSRRVVSSGSERLTSLEETDAQWAEGIVRGSYQWIPREGHGLELGAEFALNRLDTDFKLFHEENGVVIEREVFNSDSVVEEVRWEAFATHNWDMGPRWSLESALNAEFSRIEQSGADIGLSRSFSFLKPRFDLRHDITDSEQFNLRLERTVSQLDFGNFVATFDIESEQLRSGNPELVPEKTWELWTGYEKRLPDDNGLLKASVFYRDIRDHIDVIPVSPTRSAQGNLGDARVFGWELEGSLRLGWVGFPNAVVNASYLRWRSRVTDPVTDERRKFSREPPYDWSIEFRHDLIRFPISYGVEVRRRGPRLTHEVTWFRSFESKLEWSAFFESRLGRRLTLVIEGEMLGRDAAERDQRFFEINRGGPLLRTERMSRRATPQITVKLRGQF